MAMNLLEQQAANRHRTWLVVGIFVGFLLILGAGFDAFVLGTGLGTFPIGTVFALGVGLVSAWVSMRTGDKLVLLSSSAAPLAACQAAATTDEERLRYHQLDDVVEEMAISAGIPKPAVYIIPDADPNAFATGRDPQHASLAVTQGLLDSL